MAMPDPKLEDYVRGLRVLLNAKAYLERSGRGRFRFSVPHPCNVLNRAMLDVADAITALAREDKDA